MLVHRRVTSQQYVAGTHLYTCVKRDKVEWSFLSKETTRWVRLETRTSRSRVQGCNHSALHPSTCLWFHVNGKKERGGSTSCHLDQIDLAVKDSFGANRGNPKKARWVHLAHSDKQWEQKTHFIFGTRAFSHIITGRSLRAGGWGFPPATMNVVPHYILSKKNRAKRNP